MTEEELFHAAVARPLAERSTFLDAACEGDAALRAGVEALLAAHEASGCFLASNSPERRASEDELAATWDSAVAAAKDEATRAPELGGEPRREESVFPSATAEIPRIVAAGAVIGDRYALLEKIGEGGMGEVWVAKQTAPVKRKVALKLIKTGMDSRAVLQRFEQERQALALMDHPHIARVLDGGMTPTGQPYFVMELVNGLPLTKFCDEMKFTPRARLELFVPICQAVQHAHQKGIVHRDLKPANILVTMIDGKPVPKVIDFGVAKATAGKLTDETMSTGFGAVVGTLEYMSPEQAGFSGDDIDTRADIYSLGVILYELLTGLRPIDAKQLRKAALTEMFRRIQEEEPPKPSTRLSTDESLPSLAAARQTDPRKLMALLRGELDWVVMKCLEKQRDRRYETANALARDVQRYLSDEAVEARPPSRGYRLKKFVQRNKGQVVAASLVLLALLGGIVGTSFGLVRANRSAEAERLARIEAQDQKASAEKRLKQVETGSVIMAAIFEELDIHKVKAGNEPLEAVLAQRLVEAAEQLEGEAVGDAQGVAELQLRLGHALIGLGVPKEAIRLYRKSSETYARERGPDDHETLRVLNALTLAYIADGKLDQAVALAEDMLQRTKAGQGLNDHDTIAAMNSLGTAFLASRNLERALPLLEQSYESIRDQLGANHADSLTAMHNLAIAYLDTNQLHRAEPLLEECLKRNEALSGSDHPDTLTVMNGLARCYERRGEAERAIAMLESCLRRRRERQGANHPDTLTAMNNLAATYSSLGKNELALPLEEESVKLKRATMGDAHPETLVGMVNLGENYRLLGKLDQSIALLEESRGIANAHFGVDHRIAWKCSYGLGLAYWSAKQFDKAIGVFDELVRRAEARHGRRHPETLSVLGNLGVNYQEAGRFQEAIPLLEEVNQLSGEYPELRGFEGALREAYVQTGESKKLGRLWQRRLAEARQALPKESADLAGILAQIAMGLLAEGEWAEAEPFLRESLSIREKVQPDQWSTFNTRSMLGGSLAGQKKFAEAEPLLVAGYEGLKQREATIPATAKVRVREALERLAEFYAAWQAAEPGQGHDVRAAEWQTRLDEARKGAPSGVTAKGDAK